MRVSQILKPHLQPFYGIVSGAHDDYQRLYPAEAKMTHDASVKAHIIQRHMLWRADRYAAANHDRVKQFESQRLKGIIVDQLVAILFKKLDRELRSRNHVSGQIDDYLNQREIELIPSALKLVVGYRENDETGEIIGIWVTRPQGNSNRWELLIKGDDAEPMGTIPLFPDDLGGGGDEEVEITPRKQPAEVIPLKREENDDGGDKR